MEPEQILHSQRILKGSSITMAASTSYSCRDSDYPARTDARLLFQIDRHVSVKFLKPALGGFVSRRAKTKVLTAGHCKTTSQHES